MNFNNSAYGLILLIAFQRNFGPVLALDGIGALKGLIGRQGRWHVLH